MLAIVVGALVLAATAPGASPALGAKAPALHARSARPSTVLLGDATVEPQRDALIPGLPEAFRLRAHASGQIASLRLYIDARSTATTVLVGLYADSDRRPGTLLGTGSLASPHRGAWNTVTLTPSWLVADHHYWLTILGEGGTLRYRASRHGSCPSDASVHANLRALPVAWSAGRFHRHTHCPISAYATAASLGGPSGIVPSLPASVLSAPLGPVSPVTTISPAEEARPEEHKREHHPPEEEKGKEGEKEKEEEKKEEPPPPPPAPVNTKLPAITGTTTEGDTLTASTGAWENGPTSYKYQWRDCNTKGESCATIAGATAQTHKLTNSDVGHTLRMIVTATNEGGSTLATSAATAKIEPEAEEEKKEEPPPPPPAPVNTKLPAITGTTTEGDTLTASTGAWENGPTSYKYQWQDCNAKGEGCATISGAASATHKLTSSDVGHTLRVVVTATNKGGSTPATSAATAKIEKPAEGPPPPPPAPVNKTLPTITGTTIEGDTLTATNGTWENSPTSYKYQWQDCNAKGEGCATISGATSATRKLASSDVEHTLRVVVTATNKGGSTPATSAQTATVVASTGGSSYPPCTQTLSLGANVPSAVSGATAGSVICLNSGAYGSLTLNASPASDVTLQAAPSAHVTAGSIHISGSHLVLRGLWIDGEVALEEGSSFITVDHNDISNANESGGEGVVFDTSNCTVPNAPKWEGCEPHEAITNVTISGNHFHNIGKEHSEDAIHLDYWRDVTVTGNEFDHVIETGNHTDCLQSVYGGTNLTFTHNYEHDNDCQGFFIKDGDATDVSITDNLFLRDDEPEETYPEERYANYAQAWNIENLTVENNTIWDGKGLALVTEDASVSPSALIDHNLITALTINPPIGKAYALTEDYNIFDEAPWSFTPSSTDTTNSNPQFLDTATDDYRLATNPNGIGIDWSPAEEQYGPAS
ncbi:MAG TPA: right-handed parallel beta-helix repeat-containing protein [Solirubrobacteraceae bacterium]|nr:right-handed parallel beta-helix repeat-containing protein [Solirubrobacteraceae bacterium]